MTTDAGNVDSSQNNNNNNTNDNNKNNKKFHIELQGWRKQCLFALFLLLIFLVTINLVLTLWILRVMEFAHVR